jgi:hypothetical protein
VKKRAGLTVGSLLFLRRSVLGCFKALRQGEPKRHLRTPRLWSKIGPSSGWIHIHEDFGFLLPVADEYFYWSPIAVWLSVETAIRRLGLMIR